MATRSSIHPVGLLRESLVLGAMLAGLLLIGLLGPGGARAASPEPSNDLGGDTRSSGAGPGLVGAPGLAIGGVILLGLVAASGVPAGAEGPVAGVRRQQQQPDAGDRPLRAGRNPRSGDEPLGR